MKKRSPGNLYYSRATNKAKENEKQQKKISVKRKEFSISNDVKTVNRAHTSDKKSK